MPFLPRLCILALALSCCAVGQAANEKQIARGRYLVEIGGCNDCHTAGYGMSGGQVPEKQWMMGDQLGWEGPWGTTYAPNLRLVLKDMSEQQWIHLARNKQSRPPMPWWALRAMSQADLRALYHYIRSLPVEGQPAPAYLPPGQQARGPVVKFPAPPK